MMTKRFSPFLCREFPWRGLRKKSSFPLKEMAARISPAPLSRKCIVVIALVLVAPTHQLGEANKAIFIACLSCMIIC